MDLLTWFLECWIKEYEIVQVITVLEKSQLNKAIKLEDNTLFDVKDTTDSALRNKDFEKFGYSLDFQISVPLKISTDKDFIILSAVYEDIEFTETVKSGKMDDGIKKITASIYEYILNKEDSTD